MSLVRFSSMCSWIFSMMAMSAGFIQASYLLAVCPPNTSGLPKAEVGLLEGASDCGNHVLGGVGEVLLRWRDFVDVVGAKAIPFVVGYWAGDNRQSGRWEGFHDAFEVVVVPGDFFVLVGIEGEDEAGHEFFRGVYFTKDIVAETAGGVIVECVTLSARRMFG